MTKIAINNFVLRQSKNSGFSHFEGTWDELVELVSQHFGAAAPGYKEGVMLIPVPPEQFQCGVVEVGEDTPLAARFKARCEGEEPFLEVVACKGGKLPAKAVEVVVYRHDVLEDDASTDAEWEIISLNARATEGPEPMRPITMARNMLGLKGGTSAEYSAEEFARAIIYWSRRCVLE